MTDGEVSAPTAETASPLPTSHSLLQAAGTPPQSPDVHFRESDVEFLKQQARIWLESVLEERFSSEKSLTDLLADGEILRKISLKIRALLENHADDEPVSPKSMFPEAAFYGKHSGKYLPYSNVDSFLKVCQKLGLTGVDLFSPPDVVEKKDIRRVCLCIRALSKKARARRLEVPNFDFVTHTTHAISMPTEMVGGLKDSLRQASVSGAHLSPRAINFKETPEKVRVSNLRPAESDMRLEEETELVPPGACEQLSPNLATIVTLDEDNDKVPLNALSQESINNVPYYDRQSVGQSNADVFDDNEAPSQISTSGLQRSSDEVSPHDLGDDSSYSNPPGPLVKKGKDPQPEKSVWTPLLAVAVALLGAVMVIRTRDPSIYEVRAGDTLSEISRRKGKSGWKELVQLNPWILNPDLIYPGERLKLRM